MNGLRLISLGDKQLLGSLSKTNYIFQRACLKPSQTNDILNADSSLSNIQNIKTRQSFFNSYKTAEPSAGNLKCYYKFFVTFLQFYKDGIKNVYTNYKEVKLLKNKFYFYNKDIIPGVKNQHPQIKVKDTRQLIKLLSNTVRNYQNEQKASNDVDKFFDNPHNIEMTRAEFQKILRSSKDIYKLPLFALLFLLLEEFTVALCFLLPDLTPSTCLIPQLTSRFYKSASESQKKLYSLIDAPSEKMVTKSSYSLSKAELEEIVKFLQLKSRYVPISFYTEDRLRDLLQLRFQEILVDNYLILRDGGIWNLSKLEVIDACLKRGLIDLSSFITLSKSNTENFYDLVDEKVLRLQLFKHINNIYVDGVNVGLLVKKDDEEDFFKENVEALTLYINSCTK